MLINVTKRLTKSRYSSFKSKAPFIAVLFFYSATSLITILAGGSRVLALEPGNCYKALGYGAVERIVSAYGGGNGCPSEVTTQISPDKCYMWSESSTEAQEFDCSGVKECLSTSGSGYTSTTFIPNAVDCEQFKLGARGDSQVDANERIAAMEADEASESLHSADDSNSGKLFNYIKIIVIVLSAVGGLALVGSFVVAGVQYATAGDNSGSVSKAKERMVYTLIALIIYLMLFSVVNWLIPGSIVP